VFEDHCGLIGGTVIDHNDLQWVYALAHRAVDRVRQVSRRVVRRDDYADSVFHGLVRDQVEIRGWERQIRIIALAKQPGPVADRLCDQRPQAGRTTRETL
jgi:hypothetical protein